MVDLEVVVIAGRIDDEPHAVGVAGMRIGSSCGPGVCARSFINGARTEIQRFWAGAVSKFKNYLVCRKHVNYHLSYQL